VAPLTFEVLHGSWAADGEVYDAGVHEIDNADTKLVELASHAHAAGALNVSVGLDPAAVESQEASEQALVEAMGEHIVRDLPDGTRVSFWTGPWQEGNCLDYLATRGELLDRDADSDDPFQYDDDTRASVQAGVVSANRQLEHWRHHNDPENTPDPAAAAPAVPAVAKAAAVDPAAPVETEVHEEPQ
jgi:hypothetical protein